MVYMDGSFTADIPRDRLTELFHVTQTVVSQVILTMNICIYLILL